MNKNEPKTANKIVKFPLHNIDSSSEKTRDIVNNYIEKLEILKMAKFFQKEHIECYEI